MNRKQRRAAEKIAQNTSKETAASNPQTDSQQMTTNTGEPQVLSDEVAQLQLKLTEAISLHRSGNVISAEKAYREALELKPDFALSHNALGSALMEQGRYLESLDCFEQALSLDPSLELAKQNKQHVLNLFQQGSLWSHIDEDQSDQSEEQSETTELFNRANMLRQEGNLNEAANLYGEVVKRDNKHAGAYANLGFTFMDMREYELAETMFQVSLALEPDNPFALDLLGVARHQMGRPDEAIECFKRCLELEPDHHSALNNLGNAYNDLGQIDEALAVYRRAGDLHPSVQILSNVLLSMHYSDRYSAEEIYEEHIKWNHLLAEPLMPENIQHNNVPDRERRLKVGFVSGNFARHPAGYLTIGAIEAMDRSQFEVYIYSATPGRDDMTVRFNDTADVWHSVVGLPETTIADMARTDGIDILIDMTGHASKNKLLTFAYKPSPIQIKWVGGQFNTTGMTAMDYFLSDNVETPEGCDKWFTEEIIRMPNGYVCYDPPSYAPEVGPLPALKNGHVTFGCFNNLMKVQDPVIAHWSSILKRLPDARLVLKSKQLNDARVNASFLEKFTQQGIEAERIELRQSSLHHELFAQYNDIDIALDPFPYAGGLTTVEALWMGVPVITCPGITFASRHAASHLSAVGLNDWICDDLEAYADKAYAWASDLEGLSTLRQGLRGQVAGSPLCDTHQFARDLEEVFRKVWIRWCDEQD